MLTLSDGPPRADLSRTLLVLRLAVLTACGWIAVSTLASLSALGMPTRESRTVAVAVVVVALGFFAAAAWRNLAHPAGPRLRREAAVLLAIQTLVASTIASDLFVVLSLMLPLVLPRRVAPRWFAAQSLVMVAVALGNAGTRWFEADPQLRQLPVNWQVGLTIGQVLGWNLLAYSGGLLAATEIRAHREVRRLMAEVQATTELLAQTSRIAERAHIARELHDTIGHRLAALGVHLDLAERRATGDTIADLHEARAITRDLLGEVRDVVGSMRRERPIELKRVLARLLAETAGLDVEFTLSPDLVVRDPERAHALYRCAQEALTNTLRHSGANRMWLDVRQDANGVTLRARDDGRGAGDSTPGLGLRGMRERLELLGGTLALSEGREGGLELVAWLPAAEDPA